MINVTKTYLPPLEEYHRYLEGIWERAWVTNGGPLVRELESKLQEYLGVKHVLFCNNGTIAMQIAMKAMQITGEVITTPFSYVATTNSILWENCKPVFVDIRSDDFCIDASKIESKITAETKAIMAVHVYGNPCELETIERIAQKHNLKVIYDAAHAFGVNVNGRSLLSYGDMSTCSFHATKLFHSIEGGAIITNDDQLAETARLHHMFGHRGDEYFTVGINGKSSEMHAAMGLCMLPRVADIIESRKRISAEYDSQLDFSKISRPHSAQIFEYNFAYYPVVFQSEEILLRVREELMKNDINTRRYFYPSLNQLPFLSEKESCPVSEDISLRVLALPLFYDLSSEDVSRICGLIHKCI